MVFIVVDVVYVMLKLIFIRNIFAVSSRKIVKV